MLTTIADHDDIRLQSPRHQWRTYASHPSTAFGTALGASYDQAPINRRCILLVQRLDWIKPDDDAGRRVS
jgi:hypothetical protein